MLFSGKAPLSSLDVQIEVRLTCKTCGNKLSGSETSTIACRIDTTTTPYPLNFYEFVRKSYGDGWNIRASGRRLVLEETKNLSMGQGWYDAQAFSESRGGKAPPKKWGHVKSREYLKTETACHHLKMLSLNELST